ncbi:MAG: hypothetical protein ABJG88_02435 [Litorimonas sp.]
MVDNLNFQRAGSLSNAHVGRDFEYLAQNLLFNEGIMVYPNFPLELGVGLIKKKHAFDLGCAESKIIVECKSHKWTSGDKVPSAKLTVWNEAMYYFHLAPSEYRKIMFVLHDVSKKRGLSIADYYQDKYNHLIPEDVESWEVNEITQTFKITK